MGLYYKKKLGLAGGFELIESVEVMPGVYPAHRPGAAAHRQRLGLRPAAEIPHPFQEFAAADPGGRKEDIFAADQLLGGIDFINVNAFGHGVGPLLFIPGPGLALNPSADAAQRRRREHALRRSPDAHEHVNFPFGQGRLQAGADITIGYQLDPGAGPTDIRQQPLVAGPVQHHHGNLGDLSLFRFGDILQIHRHRRRDVNTIFGFLVKRLDIFSQTETSFEKEGVLVLTTIKCGLKVDTILSNSGIVIASAGASTSLVSNPFSSTDPAAYANQVGYHIVLAFLLA